MIGEWIVREDPAEGVRKIREAEQASTNGDTALASTALFFAEVLQLSTFSCADLGESTAMGACGSTNGADGEPRTGGGWFPLGSNKDSGSNTALKVPHAIPVALTTLYRVSTAGTALVGVCLLVASLQAPLVVLAGGGSAQEYQSISAVLYDYESAPGRLFAALCTFASFLNLITLHPFWLAPPAQDGLPLRMDACCGVFGACCACCRPNIDFPRQVWPLGQQGALRWAWLASQSFALLLLACMRPSNVDGGLLNALMGHLVSDLGAVAVLFVSLVLEAIVLLTQSAAARVTARLVAVAAGLLCALLFITMYALGCMGLRPSAVCPAPLGTLGFVAESLLCACVALDFLFAAARQKLSLDAGHDDPGGSMLTGIAVIGTLDPPRGVPMHEQMPAAQPAPAKAAAGPGKQAAAATKAPAGRSSVVAAAAPMQ